MINQIEKILAEMSFAYNTLKYLTIIKSGKEAVVHLISLDEQLFALKIYKENLKYSTRQEYMPVGKILDKRMQRAIKKRSSKGIKGMQEMWTNREYSILKKLNYLNANVPKVFGSTKEAILLEYLGIETVSAPRLIDVELNDAKINSVIEIILKNVKLFIDCGIIHGDLSAYNILWFNEMPYIIDFPQSLDIKSNPNAYHKLLKDLDNINKYFLKYTSFNISQKIKKVEEYFIIKNGQFL